MRSRQTVPAPYLRWAGQFMHVDTPSVLLVGGLQVALLLSVSAPMIFTAGAGQGGRRFAAGMVCVMAAFGLLAGRGHVSNFASFGLSNALLLVGTFLVYEAVYLVVEVGTPPRWLFWLTCMGVTVILAATLGDPSPDTLAWSRPRVGVSAMVMASNAGMWLHRLLTRAPRPWSLGTRFLVTAAVIGVCMHLVRGVGFAAQTAAPVDPLKSPLATFAIVGLMSVTLLSALGTILHLEARARDRLHAENLHLTKEALTDRLTGVRNRRGLEMAAQEELPRATRYGWDMAVLLLDVDHFKGVNDAWGHAAGDTVLRDVAALCRAGLRPHDVLARWGGEEFAVLLPQCSVEAAQQVAQRICHAIEAHPQAAMSGACVTISIGVAEVVTGAPNLSEAIANADAALYRAKRDGRNRVSVAEAA